MLWRASGQEGFDENVWKWKLQVLESNKTYQVFIEATVGKKGMGDIGIDDVSFTPECR